jgi:hypothetical protein
MHYNRIISDLKLRTSFLDAHSEMIQSQILALGQCLPSRKRSARPGNLGLYPDIFAVNECLGLARTVLTLGSDPDSISSVVGCLKKDRTFDKQDPVMVISSSVLYHMIEWLEQDPKTSREDRQTLRRVHRRFDDLNWMIDGDSVKALGMSKVENQPGDSGFFAQKDSFTNSKSSA